MRTDFPSLCGHGLTLAYGDRIVAQALDVEIPPGSFTVIIGPNGCGKSTLLRALARLLKPVAGEVRLDGRPVQDYGHKEFARQLGLLPQSAIAPAGISVAELVSRGRYPHQSLLQQWSRRDEEVVEAAMAATGVSALADREVDALSGGQRQRVWVAMALAQETPLLLLDEPTTYLDIAHQIELLELFTEQHQQGRTLVAVLHDLNQACRYATHLIAMCNGRIHAQGSPREVICEALIREVFGLECILIEDPVSGTPLVIPKGVRHV